MSARIAVLIPTRGRPEGLHDAIISLHEHAARPLEVAYLLRTDDDDDTRAFDIAAQATRCKTAGITLIRGSRGAGYREVYKMFNELAAASTGDWLVNWNDDAVMLTSGWDDLLCTAPPHSIQFMRRNTLLTADTTFPVTGRSVYQAMGHMSMQTHADDWMRVVAEKAGVGVQRNDVVFHHNRPNDKTARERDAGGYDTEGFNSDATQLQLKLDAVLVIAAKEKYR